MQELSQSGLEKIRPELRPDQGGRGLGPSVIGITGMTQRDELRMTKEYHNGICENHVKIRVIFVIFIMN